MQDGDIAYECWAKVGSGLISKEGAKKLKDFWKVRPESFVYDAADDGKKADLVYVPKGTFETGKTKGYF